MQTMSTHPGLPHTTELLSHSTKTTFVWSKTSRLGKIFKQKIRFVVNIKLLLYDMLKTKLMVHLLLGPSWLENIYLYVNG